MSMPSLSLILLLSFSFAHANEVPARDTGPDLAPVGAACPWYSPESSKLLPILEVIGSRSDLTVKFLNANLKDGSLSFLAQQFPARVSVNDSNLYVDGINGAPAGGLVRLLTKSHGTIGNWSTSSNDGKNHESQVTYLNDGSVDTVMDLLKSGEQIVHVSCLRLASKPLVVLEQRVNSYLHSFSNAPANTSDVDDALDGSVIDRSWKRKILNDVFTMTKKRLPLPSYSACFAARNLL